MKDCSHLFSLTWPADGKGWFVVNRSPVSWTLYHAGVDGLVHRIQRMAGGFAPDVFPSPDGRRRAFSQKGFDSNVWLLDTH